ncbi:hypothetical protein B0H14DRAFT_3158597 [Mycena olivaceomarginata]|nr:hypothetical protein B0H14DRAFT_3158597 [Mycena olivaceomarginata]
MNLDLRNIAVTLLLCLLISHFNIPQLMLLLLCLRNSSSYPIKSPLLRLRTNTRYDSRSMTQDAHGEDWMSAALETEDILNYFLQKCAKISWGGFPDAQASVCSDDHRWSDVVPPEAGLTFFRGLGTRRGKTSPPFSAAQLSELGPRFPIPRFSLRCVRQSFAGPHYHPLRRPRVRIRRHARYTAILPRKTRTFLFAEAAFFPDRALRGRTQTSSTLDGLDVYLRGSMLGKAHTQNRYYSCFQELDGDFAFDPCTSFAHMWMRNRKGEVIRDDVSDEGFFEGGQFGGMDNEVNLSSRFSGTTTSTSNFVTVENMMEDDSSTTWSALEAPNTPSYSRLLFCDAPSSKSRLRKPRPMPGPASPSNVLDRPEHNDNLPTPPPRSGTTVTFRTRSPASDLVQAEPPKIRPRFGPAEKTDEAAGWVWVEVKENAKPHPST